MRSARVVDSPRTLHPHMRSHVDLFSRTFSAREEAREQWCSSHKTRVAHGLNLCLSQLPTKVVENAEYTSRLSALLVEVYTCGPLR